MPTACCIGASACRVAAALAQLSLQTKLKEIGRRSLCTAARAALVNGRRLHLRPAAWCHPGIWTAPLIFELPLWQLSTTVHRTGAMVGGPSNLRAAADDIRVLVPHIVGRSYAVALYIYILVHGFNLLCQSSGDDCALSFRHVRRYRCGRRASFHCGAIRGHVGSCRDRQVAMAAHSPHPRC
jgi:hypothetical protein